MKNVITLGADAVGTTAVVTKYFLWWFPRITNWICCYASPLRGGVWINQETSERAPTELTVKLNNAALAKHLHATTIATAGLAKARKSLTKLKLVEPAQKIKS